MTDPLVILMFLVYLLIVFLSFWGFFGKRFVRSWKFRIHRFGNLNIGSDEQDNKTTLGQFLITFYEKKRYRNSRKKMKIKRDLLWESRKEHEKKIDTLCT